MRRNSETAEKIAAQTQGIAVICGLVTPAEAETGKSVMNSAALLQDGRIAVPPVQDAAAHLRRLRRVAQLCSRRRTATLPFCGKQIALTICEDAWNDKNFWNRRLYGVDPVEDLMRAGGNLVLNISASPFYVGKRELRRDMLAAIARKYQVPVVM